jgi:excisionase family DNA binding protein
MSTEKQFLTVREAADILLVTESTIRKWLREGTLRGQNLGGRAWRIPSEAIEEVKHRRPETTTSDGHTTV